MAPGSIIHALSISLNSLLRFVYSVRFCGFFTYETVVPFFTAKVTVNMDGAAWTNAFLTLDNGRDHYNLVHTGNGVYSADVLEGDAYKLKAEGVIDPNMSTISVAGKTKQLDYYRLAMTQHGRVNGNIPC